MQRQELRERFAVVNGLRLRWLEQGRRGAPPMVLLHGIRSGAHSWSVVARAMAPHFRVIALDQRGRGGSDWAPDGDYSLDAHVRDLDTFCESQGIRDCVLMGDSAGGRAAMAYAARRPARVSALVIVDVGPEVPQEALDRLQQEMRQTPERFPTWEAARQFVLRERPAITREALEERLKEMLREENGQVVWRYDRAIREECRRGRPAVLTTGLWHVLPAIECPTLVVRGGDSDFLPAEMAERMVREMKRGRSADVVGASHTLMEEAPRAFTDVVHRFLDRNGLLRSGAIEL